MTGVFVLILVLAGIAMVAQQKRIERMEAERDDWKVKEKRLEHSRNFYRDTCDKSLRQQLALQRRLREASLVVAGTEAATHANHLEALLDATSEKPLTLVRGGQ